VSERGGFLENLRRRLTRAAAAELGAESAERPRVVPLRPHGPAGELVHVTGDPERQYLPRGLHIRDDDGMLWHLESLATISVYELSRERHEVEGWRMAQLLARHVLAVVGRFPPLSMGDAEEEGEA
jgi:hypothetical protein